MGGTKRSINARTSARVINWNKYASETFSINAINFVFIPFATGYSVFQSKSRSLIIYAYIYIHTRVYIHVYTVEVIKLLEIQF